MTLDEFLDDYVPRVLRPMGEWHICGGSVRRDPDDWDSAFACCPLTAESRRSPRHYREEAMRLGLSEDAALAIANAADLSEPEPGQIADVRARLLAGLGLAEAA